MKYLPCWLNSFTDDDVDEMYREAPIKGSMFDYLEFTRILKHGAKDKDEQWEPFPSRVFTFFFFFQIHSIFRVIENILYFSCRLDRGHDHYYRLKR